jgi:hypothetical protein
MGIFRRWQQVDSSRPHASALYLYTDGLDNEPGRADWLGDAATRLTELRRQDLPFLFAAWVQTTGSSPVTCPSAFNGGCNPITLPTVGLGSFGTIDFGMVSEANLLSSGRTLALTEIAKAILPSGVQPPASVRIALSLQGDPGSSFDATVEPNSISLAASTTIALRARSGQKPGQQTGFLLLKAENAIWAGAERIPVRYEFLAAPATEPTMQMPSAVSIDFGTLNDATLRSERTLTFVEVSPGRVPLGATPPPASRVVFSIKTDPDGAFEAVIEPDSALVGPSMTIALRARPGQPAGVRTATLLVHLENASLSGPNEIPIRYEFSPCAGPCDTSWLLIALVLAVLWAAGVAENRLSRRYTIAIR